MSFSNRFVSPESPPSDWIEAYWPQFRRHVFSLVQMGYCRLDSDRFRTAGEEVITGELHREIENLLGQKDAPAWTDFYSIHDDPPVHAEDRKGKHRRRLDLYFEHIGSRPRPHYEFECKRLCKGKCGAADYFGADGMTLFLTGEYARRWPEAGMLGYMQSGTSTEWTKKLATKLASTEIPQLPEGGWHVYPLIEELDTYATAHPRTEELGTIRIFHALLPF